MVFVSFVVSIVLFTCWPSYCGVWDEGVASPYEHLFVLSSVHEVTSLRAYVSHAIT